MYRRYVLAGLLAMSTGALAQTNTYNTGSGYGSGSGSQGRSGSPFSYDFAEAGFGEVDEGDAVFIGGHKSVNRNVFVLGSAYMVDSGIDIPGYDGKGFYLEAGLGYAMPVAPQADVFANAQLLYANFDFPGDDDDIGYITRLGIRYMPVNQIELEGVAAYSSNDFLVDDGLGFSADARYHVNPALSAAIGYAQDTELDGAFLNVRYNFR